MERTLSHLEGLWEIIMFLKQKKEEDGLNEKKIQNVSHQVAEIKAALLCTLAYSYQRYIRVICYRLSLLIEYMDYI